MKKWYINNINFIIALSLALIIAIIAKELLGYFPIVIGVLKTLYSLLKPFLYAFVFAYIIYPIVKLYKNNLRMKKGLSVLLAYTTFTLIIIIVIVVAIPAIYKGISDIATNLPGYIKSLQNFINNILEVESVKEFVEVTGLLGNINQAIVQMGNVLVKIFEGMISGALSMTMSIVNIGLGYIISIYIVCDMDKFIFETKRFLKVILGEKKSDNMIAFFSTFHKMIGAYIGIKAIDSLIIGTISFILLTLVKSEYAMFLSIIVTITNMIPYIGPFVGEVLGFLFNVFVSPTKAIVVFCVLYALQAFDGWYLDPKLVGKKVGVSPFLIMLGVIIGGGFWGPLGMLLGSPAIATIKIYYDKLIHNYEIKHIENLKK